MPSHSTTIVEGAGYSGSHVATSLQTPAGRLGLAGGSGSSRTRVTTVGLLDDVCGKGANRVDAQRRVLGRGFQRHGFGALGRRGRLGHVGAEW